MKRVGILSMQRIFNYGSFLQAYGLKEILMELGCEVEFVDYHPGECLIPSPSGSGMLHKLLKAAEVFKYRAPLVDKIRYIKYKKNYAANYHSYLGISNQMNYSPELDVLIIGSDEVFNCVQDNVNVGFSPELFGQGNHAKKVISYAASFGNTTIEKLEKYGVSDKVANWLKQLYAISVRDMNSGKIVQELTQKEPEYNIDPVLAYDFMGKCSMIPESVPEKKYMVLYGYSGRLSKAECKIIREYANERKWKIVCIGGVQECCDSFIDCSPFEVLAYFKGAEAIVTDTFHGTIMSIITKQRFATIVRREGYGNSEKLVDLLVRTGLKDHIVGNIEDIRSILENEAVYTVADQFIQQERSHTYEYLRNQLQ